MTLRPTNIQTTKTLKLVEPTWTRIQKYKPEETNTLDFQRTGMEMVNFKCKEVSFK